MINKPLGDICKPKQSKNLPTSSFTETGYPVYGANGVIGYYKEFNHEEPTIAITCRGATCGNIHVTQNYSYITSNAMALDQLDTSNVEISYLANYLKFRNFDDVITGAAQPQITRSNLEKIQIPLPPLDDQKRIAYLLGKVESLIARRKQHLQQLDDLLKSVFVEMFGDPVRNEKGWETLPFHKIGSFTSGGTPSKSREDFWIGSFPWVSPKDMKVAKINDSIDHISETVFKETTLKRIPPNHLLIVVRGMILAHSFPVAINTVEVSINQDMKAIKPIQDINIIYLYHCLVSLKRQILKLISTAGHGTRKFDSVAMQRLFIPKPPKQLQNKFAGFAEKVESIKFRYQQSLTDLENLYGALSQKAFKGELDLSRVPLQTDELIYNKEPEVTQNVGNTTEEKPELKEQQILEHLEAYQGEKLTFDQIFGMLSELKTIKTPSLEEIQNFIQKILNDTDSILEQIYDFPGGEKVATEDKEEKRILFQVKG